MAPKQIYAVYLSQAEADQIVAIWEKTGALGSVVDSIRSASVAKQS